MEKRSEKLPFYHIVLHKYISPSFPIIKEKEWRDFFVVKKGLLGVLCFFVLLFSLACETVAEQKGFSKTLKETKYIAHAMGEVNGHCHTNSLEAFLTNYKKGFRIFEVNLILTSDQQLAARHDWQPYLAAMFEQNLPNEMNGKPLSLEELKSHKINGNLQPLSFADVVYLLKIFRDAYIITDTKTTEINDVKNQFQIIKNTVSDIEPSVLQRIIPQVYHEEMLSVVREIYPFKNIIYTLYKTNKTPTEVLDMAFRENILFVAMSEAKASKEFIQSLSEVGIDSLVYTLNERKNANSYFENGVTAIYTDRLLP